MKSHSQKMSRTLRIKFTSQGSMLKFTYKDSFLTIKRDMENYCSKIPNGEHILWCLFYMQKKKFLKKIKIKIFGGISKFLKIILFG
jgi:hypothetical protein